MAKENEEENKTIEQITKSYEERIANREKEYLAEKEKMKADLEKEKKELIEKYNKEIAEIVSGRKQVEEVQNNDEENDKSFFDKQVELTKKKLGITKEEK